LGNHAGVLRAIALAEQCLTVRSQQQIMGFPWYYEIALRKTPLGSGFMTQAILLVGEHDDVRGALRKRLEMAFPHHQVFEAVTGEEAVSMVLGQVPRLIIIDIGPPMPERLEIVRRIKTVQPSAQIVIWTIHDWENYRADALAAGATAYVLKEETQDKLLSVLAAMLAVQPYSYPGQTETEGGR
jgi:DNA-binding NarL/FixJ family response regulator